MPQGVTTQRAGSTRRLSRSTLLIAVQLTVAFLALEIVGRVANPLGISYYPETARYFDTLVREGPIGYGNRPGLVGRFWGAAVRINSLGMRDREVGPAAADGEFRLMVLGDSVPFGVGVSYEESIPYRLEELLNASRPGGPRFRTLNMGVPSYNSEQQLIQLQTLGLGLEPDAVLLLFAANDIEPKNWVLEKRENRLVDLAQRSYAACLAVSAVRALRSALRGPDAPPRFGPGHPRWAAVEGPLTEIGTICRDRGIPFVVFTLFGAKWPEGLEQLERLGRSAGFPVFPLVPWEDPRFSAEGSAWFTNSATDSHPNARGSRIYASLIHEALERAGVLPAR